MTVMAAASLSFHTDDWREPEQPMNTLLLCHCGLLSEDRGKLSHSIWIKLTEVHLRPVPRTKRQTLQFYTVNKFCTLGYYCTDDTIRSRHLRGAWYSCPLLIN